MENEKEKRKHEIFSKELISMSVSNDYLPAVLEWEFDFCEDSRERQKGEDEEQFYCLCTTKIRYLNYISNKLNHNGATVGSCCVKKFMKENKDLSIVMENKEKIKSKNKKFNKDKQLKKICEKCFKEFKLKSLDEHRWKHRCLKCFIKFKEFEKNEKMMLKINFDF